MMPSTNQTDLAGREWKQCTRCSGQGQYSWGYEMGACIRRCEDCNGKGKTKITDLETALAKIEALKKRCVTLWDDRAAYARKIAALEGES